MDTDMILKVALFTPGLNGGWGLPLLFWGPPGIGKSHVIEKQAAINGLHCETLVASIREPADFGGMPHFEEVGKTTFVKYAPAAWAADFDTEYQGRGVTFIDEITTCPGAVQAALLRLVLNRALGEYKVAPGVRFLAAANPADQAAGGWDLAQPLANRFGHLDFPIPDANPWISWLLTGEAVAEDAEDAEAIDAAALEKRVMKAWPAAYAKASGMVAAFIKARPELLYKKPENHDPKASKAWPSPRTWAMATHAVAGCMIHGASEIVMDELVSAFVSAKVAAEFTTFRNKLDLPDPEHVLDGKVEFEHNPRRLDRTMAVLSSCSALVTSVKTRQKDRATKLWTILSDIQEHAADLCVAPAAALVQNQLFGGAEARAALVAIAPVLEAANINLRKGK